MILFNLSERYVLGLCSRVLILITSSVFSLFFQYLNMITFTEVHAVCLVSITVAWLSFSLVCILTSELSNYVLTASILIRRVRSYQVLLIKCS